MIQKYIYGSPLGELLILADAEGVCGVYAGDMKFSDDEAEFCEYPDEKGEADIHIENAVRWFDEYFKGKDPGFLPDIHLCGTEFQKQVWEILLKIPYGHTLSYGEIAHQIAEIRGISRMSAQAVGGAVGANRILIMVPCHRVLGKDGSLTGFSAGIDMKEWLLKSEKIPFRK